MKNTLDTTKEICDLVNKSPNRNTKLDGIRDKSGITYKSIHSMCPTRWTIKGDTLSAVCNNHNELMDLWTCSINKLKDTEMKARVQGVESQMRSFEFIFCSLLGENIFKQTDNLSRTLQDPTMSAAQGYEVAQTVLKCLKKCRADNYFSNFFSYARKHFLW